MDAREIARRRVRSTRLTGPPLAGPDAVVRHLLAVQAQEYGPALWSLGQRTDGPTVSAVERLVADGAVLRTHVLRPTWHFVDPADLRWLLGLTAARVHAVNGYMYRRSGLDGPARVRVEQVLGVALDGGAHRTRAELAAALGAAGLPDTGHALAYALMHAELEGLICSGAPRGRQQTHALLDDRVPPAAPVDRDEALARLTLRYVGSHGPATAADLALWAGLTRADARSGLDAVADRLHRETVDGREFWSAPEAGAGGPAPSAGPQVHLLQPYDECTVHSETKGVLDVAGAAAAVGDAPPHNGLLLLDAQLAGFWKRTVRAASVLVEVALLAPFGPDARAALQDAADLHARFLELDRAEVAAGLLGGDPMGTRQPGSA